MRWVACPALLTELPADGVSTDAACTLMRMDVFVHDDSLATVSFWTESNELLILAGTRQSGDMYYLTGACPHFEGKLTLMIDSLHRYAIGLLRKNDGAQKAPWLAKVDIFLDESDDAV